MVAPILDTSGHDDIPNSGLAYPETVVTNGPNELVVLVVQLNSTTPTGVSDSDGNVWHGPVPGFKTNGVLSVYWAAKPLAGTMTMTIAFPSDLHLKLFWFTLQGADLSNPGFAPLTVIGPVQGATLTFGPFTDPNSDDFIFAYGDEVMGAGLAPPTANSPFAILTGDNGGFYSHADWLAYFRQTAPLSNQVFDPLTFPISQQIAGSLAAIRAGTGGPPPPPPIPTKLTVTVTPV